jgi:hypothetical protein
MSSFDVEQLLKSLDNEDNAFLIEQTRASIQKAKNDALQNIGLSGQELKTIHKKLKHYRYIEDLANLKYGAYIRWFRITDPENIRLTNGGTILDIKIYNEGCNVLCKNRMNRIFEIKFDHCMIFQKLTDQEQVLLDVLTYLAK